LNIGNECDSCVDGESVQALQCIRNP
jgi:hypothetical protein